MGSLAATVLPPSAPTSFSSPAVRLSSTPSTFKRRPNLKRPRDGSQPMDVPSSPTKRSRVTFDTNVEVLSAEEEENVDPIFVREEVRRAIQRHLALDHDLYERIKTIFKTSPAKADAPSTNVVRIHLQAVLANVSSLNKNCHDLVQAVLHTEWVGRDGDFIRLYARFLGNLAAAHSGYLVQMLRSLVDLLGQQKTRRIPDCKIVRQPRIHQRTLLALQYLLQLVPAASGTLAQIIQRKLAYDFSKPQERIVYTKNFMELIHYAPELKSDILAMITRELVKLDVSVQVDLEDEEDDLGDQILQDVSSSQTLMNISSQTLSAHGDMLIEDEEDDKSTTDESDSDYDDELDPAEVHLRKVRANIEQVDLLMDLLFRYYDQLVVSASPEIRDNAIEQLISHFNNIILPTYRSRHAQFLVFHFAQTSPVVVDRFVTSCISTLIDKVQPPFLRQSAAAYLAGFVGRGACVSPSVISDCFSLLCEELTILRKAYEPDCRGPDLKRYSNFYAIMQAILYIFCFRWRDLATASSDTEPDSDEEDEPEQYHFPDSIRDSITLAIHSRLNPLRVCTPVIVEQFAKIANYLRFLYLFTKIEANKHVRLSTARTTVADISLNQSTRDLSWVGDNGVMEGYFPYDPYQLPMSRAWVQNDYVAWKGVPGEEDDNDSEDEEEEEDDDIDEMKIPTAAEDSEDDEDAARDAEDTIE